MAQKLWCWICDRCNVIIEYGKAPTKSPHYCIKCSTRKNKIEEAIASLVIASFMIIVLIIKGA